MCLVGSWEEGEERKKGRSWEASTTGSEMQNGDLRKKVRALGFFGFACLDGSSENVGNDGNSSKRSRWF